MAQGEPQGATLGGGLSPQRDENKVRPVRKSKKKSPASNRWKKASHHRDITVKQIRQGMGGREPRSRGGQ